MKQNIKNWKEAVISILINRFKYIKNNKVSNEPLKVKEFTLEYQKNSDIYLEFINENIVTSGKNEDILYLKDTYDIFKTWYKEAHTSKNCPNRATFKEKLRRKI